MKASEIKDKNNKKKKLKKGLKSAEKNKKPEIINHIYSGKPIF